jgi:ribosomal-protein-alanine N-acetyltransferase
MNEAETRADAPDRVVLLGGPGANPAAGSLLRRLGFAPISETLRTYRGTQQQVSLADVYGLACLELGREVGRI